MLLEKTSPTRLLQLSGLLGFLLLVAAVVRAALARRFPGPFFAKLNRFWYFSQMHKSDFHLTNLQLHRQHGKFVQVMPGYVTIDDPEAFKTIYDRNSGWAKGEFYTPWNVGSNADNTNLFSERQIDRHSEMRRKVAAMYSVTSLVSYETYVDECTTLLHKHFHAFALKGSVINFARWCQCYAFDAITAITFGERLGFLDRGEDAAELIEGLDRTHVRLTYLGVFPEFTRMVKFLAEMLSGKSTLAFMDFVQKKIGAARQNSEDLAENDPTPMVQKFMNAKHRESKSLTNWEIFAHSGSNVGAGSDTTSASLAIILYFVYSNPKVLQRLREELDALKNEKLPAYQEVQKLPYLQAVIKEAFRMAPGVGLPLWREVPKGGAFVCGEYFPEGMSLGVNAWVAHHNIDVYGTDADEYRPERWLNEDVNKMKAMEGNICTFGLGSRTCVGKNISLLELNKVVPVLVKSFDFEFMKADGTPITSALPPTRNKWFIKLPQLHARISQRSFEAGESK